LSAANPNPQLAIKSSYRGQAFRAIETVLRSYGPLDAVVNTWRSMEGYDTDFQAITTDMMPLVALSPIPYPMVPSGVDMTQIVFGVSVQMWVKGTCIDDLLALWELVEDSILETRKIEGITLVQYVCPILKLPDGTTRSISNLRPQAPAFPVVNMRTVTTSNGNSQVTPESIGGDGVLTCKFMRTH
jgi:hypothetical protein